MDKENYYELTPSIGGSFGYAFRKIFGNAFLILLLVVIITGLLNGPLSVNWKGDSSNWLNVIWGLPAFAFSSLYGLLFIPVIRYGEKFVFIKAIRNKEVDLNHLFEGFRGKYIKIVLANFLVTVLIIIGFVFLIVPGIIVLCRLVFVPFLVMDKEMEPMQAVEKSWQMTRGHGWKVFWMYILSFFILIAGVLVLVVGIILSFMWIHAAFATLYQSVLNETDDENPIPILEVKEVS